MSFKTLASLSPYCNVMYCTVLYLTVARAGENPDLSVQYLQTKKEIMYWCSSPGLEWPEKAQGNSTPCLDWPENAQWYQKKPTGSPRRSSRILARRIGLVLLSIEKLNIGPNWLENGRNLPKIAKIDNSMVKKVIFLGLHSYISAHRLVWPHVLYIKITESQPQCKIWKVWFQMFQFGSKKPHVWEKKSTFNAWFLKKWVELHANQEPSIQKFIGDQKCNCWSIAATEMVKTWKLGRIACSSRRIHPQTSQNWPPGGHWLKQVWYEGPGVSCLAAFFLHISLKF